MTIGIWIMSDLHGEFLAGSSARTDPARFPTPENADLLVLAGDIDRADRAIQNARKLFPRIPLVMIAGNHEFYKSGSGQLGTVQKMRAIAKTDRDETGRQTYFLENETVEMEIRGETLRMIGCTLWTDMEIMGDLVGHTSFAATAMNDYAYIRSNTPPYFDWARPNDTRSWHFKSRGFLGDELRKPFHGTTVVVTHHLPCSMSIADEFKSDPLTSCYASNCVDLLNLEPVLWVHGHQHKTVDYMFDKTRVVANPRGYPGDFGLSTPENDQFDHGKVVEV
jgi:Calcineurin-like phosphoesterase